MSATTLVERIASNDATLKELRLGETYTEYFADVGEIVGALGNNTVIDYVRIDRDFLPSLLGQPEKKAAVVTAIGKLPALRELRIMSGPVHANVLGLALSDASNLEYLELGAIDLKGSQEDIKHFEDALRGHGKLSSFAMANFTVNQDGVDLDELIKALGSVPNLAKVNVAAHKTAKAHFTGQALAALVADNQFQELRIANFRLEPQHYDLIASAVAKTTTLQTLRLNNVGMAQPCLLKLSNQGMATNQSLVMLDLSNNLENVGVTALATSLQNHATLKHLRLWDNKLIGDEGYKALAELLSTNQVIEKMEVPPNTSNCEYVVKIETLIKDKRMAMAA